MRKENNLPARFRKTIGRYAMVKKGDRIVAAVSGGIDSSTLLYLLDGLKAEMGLTLAVCHLNHNLRGRESERDFNFVKDTARSLGLRFFGRKLKPGELKVKGESLQEAARTARYRFFEETAKKFKADRVALGHTLDDRGETVMMRLIKGSGLKGLASIPPVRGIYIRPLIEISRDEIERFAAGAGIGHVTDSTNRAPGYLRNSVRLKLIPFIMKEYNPAIKDTLSRTAAVLALEDEYISEQAQRLFSGALVKRDGKTLALDCKKLMRAHRALAARAFSIAVGELSGAEVYGAHIDSVLGLAGAGGPSASLDLPGGLTASREYGRLILSVAPKKPPRPFDAVIKIPGTTPIKGSAYSFRAALLEKMPDFAADGSVAYFDYDGIKGRLHARPMSPGDRITPLGMAGSKKIKEILIEKKVPRLKRAGLPVVFCGKDALWVCGMRRSGLYKVTGGTKRVLRLEFLVEGALFRGF